MKQFESLLNENLEPDEQVLWTGKPRLSKVFDRTDLVLIPLGLYQTLFGLFYLSMALDNINFALNVSGPGSKLFYISIMMVIPVIAISFYLLLPRLIIKTYIKAKTHYAITNCRVIVIRTNRRNKIKHLAFVKIEYFEIRTSKSGTGNLYFNKLNGVTRSIAPLVLSIPFLYDRSRNFTFFDVDEIESVRDLFVKARNKIVESCSQGASI